MNFLDFDPKFCRRSIPTDVSVLITTLEETVRSRSTNVRSTDAITEPNVSTILIHLKKILSVNVNLDSQASPQFPDC